MGQCPAGLLFLLACAGVPLWMVLRYPGTAPDYAAAHAYPAAKAALATGGKPETGCRCSLSSANGTREEPRADPAGDMTVPTLASQRRGGVCPACGGCQPRPRCCCRQPAPGTGHNQRPTHQRCLHRGNEGS